MRINKADFLAWQERDRLCQMSAEASDGPFTVIGQRPTILGPVTPTGQQAAFTGGDANPDLAPSLIWAGDGVRDPRWLPRIGAGALVAGGYPNQDIGWFSGCDGLVVVDAVPSTLGTANIAAAQAAASGTPLTLAGPSTGITVVPAGGLSLFLPLGTVIPAGAIVLDGNPGYLGGGTSGAFQFWDPTKAIARAVSVTANAAATGGVIAITGYDAYGNLIHQNITAVAATTVTGTKAFKFIVSAVPQFTDAGHTYSIGTSDVYGSHLRMDRFTALSVAWDTSWVTTNTGFTGAVTATATALTGDTRGTFTTPTASNGTRRLYMAVGFSPNNVVTSGAAYFANAVAGMLGVPQF